MANKTITAIFDTREKAEAALRKLEDAGFGEKELTLLVTEETRGKYFNTVKETQADTGAAAGAAIGGVTGALILGLGSAGTLLVPGLNLIVSGALVGSLMGLGAGAAAGGLIGMLVGLGIPETEAKLYDEAVRKGGILLTVQAQDEDAANRVMGLLRDSDARNVSSLAA